MKLQDINIKIGELQVEIVKLKVERAKEVLSLRLKGAKELSAFMKKKKLTFQEIGNKVGVSRQRIHQIANPKKYN